MVACARTLLSQRNNTASAKQLLSCILAGADHFTAGAPQHDDMTLLICMVR